VFAYVVGAFPHVMVVEKYCVVIIILEGNSKGHATNRVEACMHVFRMHVKKREPSWH